MSWTIATKEERKQLALRFLIIGLIMAPIGVGVIYLFRRNLYKCFFMFLSIMGFTISSMVFAYKSDWIDRKVGFFDSEFIGASYQAVVFFLFGIWIALAIGYFGLGLIESGITSAVGFGLSMIFVGILTLWRTDVFNNNSRLLLVEDEFGNKYYKEVLGYHPALFWVPLMGAGTLLGMTLHNFLDSIFFNTTPIINNIPCVILSIFVCYLTVSPHIANKYLPFEIRTSEGLKKFFMLILVLIFISGLITITVRRF